MLKSNSVLQLKQQLSRFGLNPREWDLDYSLKGSNLVMLRHRLAKWNLRGRVAIHNQEPYWQELELC